MIASDLFDRDLERWLESEAAVNAPSGLHAAVIDRARESRQRPHWVVAMRGGTIHGGALGRRRTGLTYLLVVLAVASAVVLAGIVVGALRSDHIKLGRNGSIAYAVNDNAQRNQPYHAFLMDADGSGGHPIYPANCPMFSNDGAVLVYTTGSHSTAELNVAGPGGKAPRVVLEIGESDHALSPDGTRVAWFKSIGPITSPDGNTTFGYRDELWVTPLSGGPGVRIVPVSDATNESYGLPVWSPDGRQIAFTSSIVAVDVSSDSATYASRIQVVDADGADLHSLTTRPGSASGRISWSPDGRYVAYRGLPDGSPPPSRDPGLLEDGVGDIFVVSVDGTDGRDVTNTTSDEFDPQWSPDGAHLAFRTAQDLGRLTTIRMDGPTALGSPMFGPESDGFTWSPDGTMLLSVRALVTDVAAGNQDVQSWISSVDAEFRQPPMTLRTADSRIPCVPSWQRLEP